MSYSALYRRLRPKNFRDIVGQEHIVRTLSSQILSGRISHAYLFCGTRGTGKTTTAKVFAKAVNCENPSNGEPCHVCAACAAIDAQRSLNVIEIDAASNNGVDNIRDIREEVKYPPAEGKYKIYIIDEAHMLSTGASNALLKTLEEPPSGVIFILATTDPQKIPPTIHSRCQRFDFKRISRQKMTDTLSGYMKDEGFDIEESALSFAAAASDGSMRDALSLLDQCASYYIDDDNEQNIITLDMLLEIRGSAGTAAFFALFSALRSNDAAACIEVISSVVDNGKDIHQFTSEFISFLRDALVAARAPKAESILDYSGEKIVDLRSAGLETPHSVIIGYINALSELLSRLRYAGNGRVLLEACCIGLLGGNDIPQPAPVPVKAKKTEIPPPSLPPESSEPSGSLASDWSGFVASFGGMDRALLSKTKVRTTGPNRIAIICENAGTAAVLRVKGAEIAKRIRERFGIDATVEFLANDGTPSSPLSSLRDKIDFDILEE